MIYHKWIKGQKEEYGTYVYRDDNCECGCVRRTVLDNNDRQQIESYTFQDSVFTEDPGCARKERKKYKTNKGLTRGPGGEGRFCYYYLEDGECALENPKVWNRLLKYVPRLIKFTPWIKIKNFAEPSEILLATLEDISKDPNYPKDINWIIRKINTQTGREWWKYLKIAQPAYYLYLQNLKASYAKTRVLSEKDRKLSIEYNKNEREMLSDYYVSTLAARKLIYNGGEKLTGKQFLQKYPKLVIQEREKILEKRQRVAIKESEMLMMSIDEPEKYELEMGKIMEKKDKTKIRNKVAYEKRKSEKGEYWK